MRHDCFRVVILCAVAIFCGRIGWSGETKLLPVAMFFPVLWSLATSRFHATLVSASYFLAASRGLPQGVATFYASDLWPGLLLWFFASSGFAFVHAAAWTGGRQRTLAARYIVASLVMSVPPFGIVGWAHPITAAGVLFPGGEWLGLLATAVGLAFLTTSWRIWAGAAVCGFWAMSIVTWSPRPAPEGWYGVNLRMGEKLGRQPAFRQQQDLNVEVQRARGAGIRVLIFPESTLGPWTPTADRWWRRQLAGTGVNVIAGAAVVNETGYANVLVDVSENRSFIAYQQRMPIPLAMWQPWLRLTGEIGGVPASPFGKEVAVIAGSRVAPLLCYEQLLVWPILHSMLQGPDIVIAVGNGWWTAGTSIVPIQRASVEAWARLFAKPVVSAFNT